jgi:hypothetical protein
MKYPWPKPTRVVLMQSMQFSLLRFPEVHFASCDALGHGIAY